MTAAKDLSLQTLSSLHDRLALHEIGAPYRTLSSPMGEVGAIRLFTGATPDVPAYVQKHLQKVVYIGLSVDAFGLDSHMIFAFTTRTSAVPHFTLDSVMSAPDFAFHLDLIPRVDPGANLNYLNAVYQPLDRAFEAAGQIDGLKPARLGALQYALMSPWMLVYRANAAAFNAIQAPVQAYLDHWCALLETGDTLTASVDSTPDALTERDRRNRAAIFSPAVDPVWTRVERLVGAEMGAEMRAILTNQDTESVDGV